MFSTQICHYFQIADTFLVLWETFPDIDANFLLSKLEFSGRSSNQWAAEFAERGYRTVQTAIRRTFLDERRQLLTNPKEFRVEQFLDKVPDPDKTFLDVDPGKVPSQLYQRHARAALGREFSAIHVAWLEDALRKHNYRFLPAYYCIQVRSLDRLLPSLMVVD